MARFDFRHGIARRQQDGAGNPTNLQPSNGGSYVDLIVSPDPTVFICSHFEENYMQSENATVAKAWGPFTSNVDYWLYWDIDFTTGELSRGFSLLEPEYGNTPPPSPSVDQHWYDTTQDVMKVWTGSTWIEKLRVFVCKYQSGATIIDYPLGSQVGKNNDRCNAGKILFDPDGTPIQKFQRNRRGRFITTETPMHSQFNRIGNFRVEAAIVQGEAQENIAIHHCVAYFDFDQLVVARHTDPSRPCIGLAMEDMYTGEVRSYITKGFVTNEADWDWSAYPVSTPLFVGPAGELIPETPPSSISFQQVGIIVNRTTVFIDINPIVELNTLNPGNQSQLLVDRTTGRWKAGPPGSGGMPMLDLNDLGDVTAPSPGDGDVIIFRPGQGWVNEPSTATDEFVKVSGTDMATGHLDAKVVPGTGIALNILNPGTVEQLEVSLNANLDDLGDVTVASMVPTGYLLGYNGAEWVPTAPTVAVTPAGLFVTDVTSPGGGIIGDFVYAPGTIPANVVVLEATSDQEVVRIHFIVEGGGALYSPTVIVDVGFGNVTATLTQDPQDIRTFHGYADVNIADGLFAGRMVHLEASTGAIADVLIKRAEAAPEIQSMQFDAIYPTVPPDAGAGYVGGVQTAIKAGDEFYVSGVVDNNASVVTLITTGAVGAGTYSTDTAGSSLSANDSAGVGVKNFTIRFNASNAIGLQQAQAIPANAFGSEGSAVSTSNSVMMDQAPPAINIGSVVYPAGQQALKGSETATVNNTVSGHDHVYYYENGGAGNILISNQTVYETAKLVQRIGGAYLYNADNFAIQAFKTSNGTSAMDTTGDVNISTTEPTVSIAGAGVRLISSPGGEDYVITLTFTQRLLQAPTISSDGDPTAGDRGTWSGSGDTWSFTLTVDDADDKGTYNWTVDNVVTLSNNVYNDVTITSGDSYEIGGFTTRLVVVGALEPVVDLGVDITDPSKVVVKYAGTTDNLTYRGSDLSQFQKGWSTVDGSQLVFTSGPEPFPNYSNFVFQDASATPTSWFFLTDGDFAGSNTTGTLTIEIGETA